MNKPCIQEKATGIIKQAPVEDLGYVILENDQITLTQAVAQELSENNVALIFCAKNHMPVSMTMNLDAHYIQQENFTWQINASEPLKKNLWKQIIKAKILNQSTLLEQRKKNNQELIHYSTQINSGDTTNEEAKAARVYWERLFDFEGFHRERGGKNPNSALNYGYAILRAATARALIGVGILPTLGIHHHNRYNSFCLADDIMEPYRPFVDKMVCEICKKYPDYLVQLQAENESNRNLTTDIKKELLTVLTLDTRFKDKMRPLMLSLTVTSNSLNRCFRGESNKITYPVLI
jgi:CRISPR-associated protein Cas1